MAGRSPIERQTTKRQPLGELHNHLNSSRTPANRKDRPDKHNKPSPVSAHCLPHNESLEPNGSLTVRSSQPASPELHQRVSQLTSEERDAKRSSAISNSSTNASTITRKRKTFIGHWQLGKTIGKGGCSSVRMVRHRYRDQYGAVKIIARSTAETTRAQSLANLIESTRSTTPSVSPSGHKPIPFGLVREIAIMKLLEHPNIVRLYDVWENHNELYLIMEYVDGGELFHYVDERKGLPEDEAVYIFQQVVSALLYCHRLLVCHRDLKPENILLNQRDLTVKLIDFGMAALQPEGRLLSTPCGSPHYAAPEVVSTNPYDGKQADVWSCGVILYVMLTGTTPYNYDAKGDIRTLFRDIARAEYHMPPELSFEAKDLLRHIFVPDPKLRITMDGVWEHSLLHKYDEMFGFVGPEYTKEAAIGEVPKLEHWRVKRAQDIDREILRNMRTLWHSEPEQSLIKKLLNNDHNQEKLFYAALLKHRAENQENYIGDPNEMGYSASDHHHNEPDASLAGAPPLPCRVDQPPRSQSHYSIMNNEHLKASHSPVQPAPSVSSYDPYRASRDPIVSAPADYNVTIHHPGSHASRSVGAARSLRHPNSIRIEMLKQQNRRSRNNSSSSLARSAGVSKRSTLRSSTSYNSMRSSNWGSSPPVIATMRPSDRHKRGVSFGHLRKTSSASWLTTQASLLKASTTSSPPRKSYPSGSLAKPLASMAQMSTPTRSGQPAQQVTSRKERPMRPETPSMRPRPLDTPGHLMRSEIRKHSAELEKACEEAFFRSSVGSSTTAHTSITKDPSPCDTPPSSVSTPWDMPNIVQAARPLPDIPKDTPNTYLTKTLEETREKLAAYKPQGDDSTDKFEEVMRMLENIMPRSKLPPTEKRASSAPEVKPTDHISFLPMISEESDQQSNKEGAGNWHRSVTEPVRKNRYYEDQTIRMVAPSSPGTTPAPLKIKKRSSGSQLNVGQPSRLSDKASYDTLKAGQPAEHQVRVKDEIIPQDPEPTLRKKRSGWFGLGRKEAKPDPPPRPTIPGIPASWLELDDRYDPKPDRAITKKASKDRGITHEQPGSATSSEFPMRKKRFGERKGLPKWLRKRGGKDEDTALPEGDATFETNQSFDSFFAPGSPTPSSTDAPPSVGPERSWFARFFNLKPAVKVLCFDIPRGRARQELVLLLKEWQRHGIRDLQYSRRTNIITARVDRNNTLDIKAVSFRVELFVVLEHGRKVGLSIARFVQVKGAASGFRRVLDVVDGVMRGRGWLVEDEEKWAALCEVVGG